MMPSLQVSSFLSNLPGQAKITLLAWSTARLVPHSWHCAKRASWAPKRRCGGTIRAIVSSRAYLSFKRGVSDRVNKTRNINVGMDATPINDKGNHYGEFGDAFLTTSIVTIDLTIRIPSRSSEPNVQADGV